MGSPTFSSPGKRSQRLKTLCGVLLFDQGLLNAARFRDVLITLGLEKREVCSRVHIQYRGFTSEQYI